MKSFLLRVKQFFTPMRALIFGLILILCIAVIFRYLTPKRSPSEAVLKVPTVTKPVSSVPKTIKIISEYQPIEIPNSFTVAQFQVSSRTFADIAELFGLALPQNETNTSSEDQQTTLSLDVVTNLITYAYNPKNQFDAGSITHLDKEKAILEASKFVTQRLGLAEAVPLTDQLRFYIVDQQFLDTTDTEKDATMLSLPFGYRIDGQTAKVGDLPQQPIVVYVDSVLQVRKAIFFPTIFSSPTTKQIASISPSEAVKNLDQSAIEQFYRNNNTKIPIQNIETVRIKKLSIEYRIDPKTGISIPKYRFEGDAEGKNNETATLSFLVPAVKIELGQ